MRSCCLTVPCVLRRCLLALMLLLSRTCYAVGGRPTSTAATHHADTLPNQSDQVQACPPSRCVFGRHIPFAAPLDPCSFEESAKLACSSPDVCEPEALKIQYLVGEALLQSAWRPRRAWLTSSA